MHFLSDRSKRHFKQEDPHLAEDLAARASTAIENAQLFRELGLSESRYRSLIEATSSLAWSSDPTGRFVEPQPAWSAYCGQTWENRATTDGHRRCTPRIVSDLFRKSWGVPKK